MKKKKDCILPYGLALMILRGATVDLQEAIKRNDKDRVKLCSDRLYKAKDDLIESSSHDFDKNSFVCQTYKKIEEYSLISADIAVNDSINYFRTSIKLI